MYDICTAVLAINSSARLKVIEEDYDRIEWLYGTTPISKSDIPSKRLKGFEFGKIGPKDGNDYIGGNYATAFNFATTLPGIFKDLETIDFSFFVDAANVWGVDYSDTIDDNSKIRTSSGLAVDWLTPIGPLSFSFAKPITKADTDRTENFRFDIGTTF